MSEDRRKILEMLEAGAITQEDARRLLDALGEEADPVQPEEPLVEKPLDRAADPLGAAADQLAAEAEKLASQALEEGQSALRQAADLLALTLYPEEFPDVPEIPEIPEVPEKPPTPPAPRFPQDSASLNQFTISVPIWALNVNWINGQVEIVPWEGTELRVTETANRPMKDDERMDLTVKKGVLQVAWVRRKLRLAGLKNLSKRLLVEVPAGQRLDSLTVDSVSAGVRFERVPTGELKINCVSGGLYAGGAAGEKVELGTVSGDLEADGFAGERVSLNSVSGTITARGTAGELHADTVSGKIDLMLENLPRSINTETVSSKTTLTLPGDAPGFSVKYEGVSGQLESDFPLTGELKKHSGNGAFGDASACRVEMETVSGKMRLLRG